MVNVVNGGGVDALTMVYIQVHRLRGSEAFERYLQDFGAIEISFHGDDPLDKAKSDGRISFSPGV
jgi:hypothetical protein